MCGGPWGVQNPHVFAVSEPARIFNPPGEGPPELHKAVIIFVYIYLCTSHLILGIVLGRALLRSCRVFSLADTLLNNVGDFVAALGENSLRSSFF